MESDTKVSPDQPQDAPAPAVPAAAAQATAKPPAQAQEQVSPSNLAGLPPEVLHHVLCTLPLSERAKLRQCGYQSLAESVSEFDRHLMRSIPEVQSSRGSPIDDQSDDEEQQDVINDALRREMVDTTERHRWLDSTSSQTNNSTSTNPRDRPCHLRRLTKGDFNAPVRNFDGNNPKGYLRSNGAYSSARLIDGHLWVLYSGYWHTFEVFDLDTGKAIHFYPAHGPDRYYVNDEEERMMMGLVDYDGRYGMLAGVMTVSGGGRAHGSWSGPYVSVWKITTEETLLAIDLYKPNCRIHQVNIVSHDKLVILLEEPNGDFVIQWHRIPTTPIGRNDEPPPPDPPGIEVSRERRKRPRLDPEASDDEETTSYDYRTKYEWWPCQRSLIQSDKIGRSERGDVMIASDGNGFLVTLVKDIVHVWLVSTMEEVRWCQTLADGRPFHLADRDTFSNLTMHTDMFPIEDTLGPGEGAYYAHDHNREVPDIKRNSSAQGSFNPIDLNQADAQTILSRFSHLTYDEQRNFERGRCGLNVEGEVIKRNTQMKEGSCSPQLDCVVRVAFVLSKSIERRYVFHLDLKPFHHLRHRESIQAWDHYDDFHIAEFEASCLGLPSPESGKIGLWNNGHSHLQEDKECGYEMMHVLEWRRGGVFDIPNEGPCEDERETRINRMIGDTLIDDDDEIDNHPALLKEVRAFNSIERRTYNYRAISSLYVDSHKLMVCTSSEVAILPFPLSLPGTYTGNEAWRSNLREHLGGEYHHYRIEKDTEVWQSFRPLDAALISRWNKIRDFAILKESGNSIWSILSGTPLPIATLPDPDRVNTIETITADLVESMSKEESLLDAMSSDRVCLWFPQVSWRYFVVVSSALNESDNGNERLSVFDILAGWENKSRSRVLENGIHFNDDLEEGAEEDEESQSDSEMSYC